MAPVQEFMDEKLMEWDGGAGAYHNQPENNTTSWPNLKVETFQIVSWAEILSWAECGNNLMVDSFWESRNFIVILLKIDAIFDKNEDFWNIFPSPFIYSWAESTFLV